MDIYFKWFLFLTLCSILLLLKIAGKKTSYQSLFLPLEVFEWHDSITLSYNDILLIMSNCLVFIFEVCGGFFGLEVFLFLVKFYFCVILPLY